MDAQAIAAIHAAIITSDATVLGAKIQGGLTLAAGLVVIVAAYIQYLGNIAMVKHERDAHEATKSAYRAKMEAVLFHHASRTLADVLIVKQFSRYMTANPGRRPFPSIDIDIPAELEMAHWRDHALLGQDFVRRLTFTHAALMRLREWFEENRGVTSEIEIPDMTEAVTILDGLPHYPPKKAHVCLLNLCTRYEDAVIEMCATLNSEITRETLTANIT